MTLEESRLALVALASLRARARKAVEILRWLLRRVCLIWSIDEAKKRKR